MKNMLKQVEESRKVNRMNFHPEEGFSKTEIETKTQELVMETIQKLKALGRDQVIISTTNLKDFRNGEGATQGCMVCHGEFAFQHAMRIIRDSINQNPLICVLVLKELSEMMK